PVAPDGALVLGAEDLAEQLADPFDQYFHVHSRIPAWWLKDGKGAGAGQALGDVAEDGRSPVVGDERRRLPDGDGREVGVVIRDVDDRRLGLGGQQRGGAAGERLGDLQDDLGDVRGSLEVGADVDGARDQEGQNGMEHTARIIRGSGSIASSPLPRYYSPAFNPLTEDPRR